MAFTPSAVLELSTLNNMLDVAVEPIFRKSVIFGGAKAHGRISYGAQNSGKRLEWKPRIRRRSIQAVDPYNVSISFPSRNLRMKATLDWISYNLGDKITHLDKLANRQGKWQQWNLVEEVIKTQATDFVDDLAEKIYTDGGTNTQDLMGFESMTTVNGLISGGYVGDPNDDYADHATDLGDLGGSWTGTWPAGSGTTDYCAWSPLVEDYNASRWVSADGATSATWRHTWQMCMNHGMSYLGRLQKTTPDVCVLDTDLWRQAKDSLRANERFVASSDTKLTQVGFKTWNWEGLEIAHEYAVPSGVGYMFPWDALEIHCMEEQIVQYERDHKIESLDDLYAAYFFGQMRFETPAWLVKLAAISAGS